MDIVKYVENLFNDQKESDEMLYRKEINAMRYTQPPEEPTFIVNQEEIKQIIKQKLTDTVNAQMFSHIVITGDAGAGKTHFLNWLGSHFSKSTEFYSIKFKVEETSQVKYNFNCMIVEELFVKYEIDFSNIIKKFMQENINDSEAEEDRKIENLSKKLNSYALARVLYQFIYNEKFSSAAKRVLQSCFTSGDLLKLKIKRLTSEDYLDLIRVFLKYKSNKGCLLVMLDEFEHSYLALKPAMRRDFLQSYKSFINQLPVFAVSPLALFTATTEQYEGQLRNGIDRLDRALWSRMSSQVVALKSFNPTETAGFNKLFCELVKRYKVVYQYDIGIHGALEMRKKLLENLGGNSTQSRSYREIVSTMIKIMDDMRRQNEKFSEKKERLELNFEDFSFANDSRYKDLIMNAEKQWLSTSPQGGGRSGLIKSGLEEIVKFNGNKIAKVPYIASQTPSMLYVVSKDGKEKLFYIAVDGKISLKLRNCIKQKEEIQSSQDKKFTTYFIYKKVGVDIKGELDENPDIISIDLNNIIYDLLAFTEAQQDEQLKNEALNKLQDIIKKITG